MRWIPLCTLAAATLNLTAIGYGGYEVAAALHTTPTDPICLTHHEVGLMAIVAGLYAEVCRRRSK